MKSNLSAIAVSSIALIAALSGSAYASDIFDKGGLKDEGAAEYSKSWTGPWGAVVGGYSILTVTEDGDPFGGSIEGGFVQGELGYDYQISGRGVLGAYVCASYSAIEGLADGYCVMGRGGILLTRDTLLFGNVGWRWQGTDEDGGDNVYFSGPAAGIGVESRWTQHTSVKVGYEHQWITDVDGETVPDDIDVGDNRVMAGIVFRY